MMNRTRLAVVLTTVCALTSLSHAQVRVLEFRPGFTNCQGPNAPYPGEGWFFHSQHAVDTDFQVAVHGCMTGLRIFAVDPSDDIGRVTIANTTSSLQVSLWQHQPGPTLPACRHFRGIHVNNSTFRPNVDVAISITGNLTGSIDAGSFSVNIEGSLSAPLRARRTGTNSHLTAAATTAAGTLLSDNGDIGNVFVTGEIAGDITAGRRVSNIDCGSLQANVSAVRSRI
jgi:hypothetical protein